MDRDQNSRRNRYQGGETDYPRSEDQGGWSDVGDAGDRGLQRRGSSSIQGEGSGGSGGSGDWQGYVIPYRYYGPGYRGVGYYAVYYQGGTGELGETSQGDSYGRGSGFDEQGVRHGQGQGTGAAWDRGGTGMSGRKGGFAGRGPKGYQRSDERIREEVSDRLTEHDELDASEIEVSVKDGEVTLTGMVDDREAKRLAGDVAEEASGVRDVMNQLKVAGGTSGRSSSETGRTRESSGTSGQSGQRAASRGRPNTAGTASPKTTTSRSRTPARTPASSREPVGAGVGGATDGATGNGTRRATPQEDPSV